ncbi:Cytochrome b5 [Yamadazyma tenuis]|uniref:Cytochrome b5 n=1 Tax=Candida tenuis (strain ATCC 10573 / BCRC 21748 / CBS 615 / JCM 9827 / NBRC 10315 / NRRL Y-1498 / VKM Y-70) TaxID=590646 RepID=G3B955_CANTC|nr:cytochrome b5 [Yamadazyma tenuis ATCC 10573]EGV62467.1 cytochrome b5 [Yamadazyma tenuis ATCC 10573]WEJ93753.1 Cytochrome b5 [Yamadazyma tenuis]
MSEEEVLKIYTIDEVAEHKSADDLWMVYNGLVYDCSSFLDEHPGGEEVVLDVAGTDATEEFDDIGHSDDAHEILKGLLIGKLEGGVVKEIKSQLDFEEGGSNLPVLAAVAVVVAVGAYFVFVK